MRTLLPVLAVIIIFPAIFHLLFPGFFVSDDGEWMIIRFTSFYQELRNLQIPVRYLERLNYGHGYPVATFLYPGFMYIASVFKLIGLGFIASVKAVFILSIVSAFIGSYLWLHNHFSKFASILGATLYIYHPYFLWDIYKRGSVGEILALGLIPLILYLIDRDKRLFASILTGLLLISHNTLSLLFTPFILIYLFISEKSLIRTVSFTIISLGISAFFWVPAMVELPLTVFSTTTISNFSEYLVSNLFLAGPFHIFIAIAALIYSIINRKRSWVVYMMIFFLFISLFLAYPISQFLWTDTVLGKFIQFPFRFLSVSIVCFSYLGAFLFNSITSNKNIITFVSVVAIIAIVIPFLLKVEHIDKPDDYYATNVDTTTVKNEYMPKWVNTFSDQLSQQKIERVNADTLQINTIYWPGHKVVVDGSEVPVDYNNEYGFMRIKTNSPPESVKVNFQETPLRIAADAVSILFLAVTMIFIRYKTPYV
jgi:hypothetical protein